MKKDWSRILSATVAEAIEESGLGTPMLFDHRRILAHRPSPGCVASEYRRWCSS